MRRWFSIAVLTVLGLALAYAVIGYASERSESHEVNIDFPPALDHYDDDNLTSVLSILRHRIATAPFNLVAALIFLCAIIHTFLTSKFTAIANRWHHEHQEKIRLGNASKGSVSIGAGIFHFLGEVEAEFGLWVVALVFAITGFYNWQTVIVYVGETVNFTEPMFVVVIMTLAATRPILQLAETIVRGIAGVFGDNLIAWWATILSIGPLLGSFITEPAAMTICALLLSRHFFQLDPSNAFKYATVGVLFVNISVGGTLTHFAAPPVLMVAAPWNWNSWFMITTFGWKAVLGIVLSTALYLLAFRHEMAELQKKHQMALYKRKIQKQYVKAEDLEAEFNRMEEIVNNELGFVDAFEKKAAEIKERLRTKILKKVSNENGDKPLIEEAFDAKFREIKLQEMRRALPGLLSEEERAPFSDPEWDDRDDRVPWWVVLVHVAFMGWTILNVHHPALFIPGLLFFLGFAEVTSEFQNRIDLRPPIMVGFFLGGLVIHGGVQGWWIDPILSNLSELPLMLGATILTAFNDNAAITYLSTLVPGFTPELKYAVVSGAVAGGGLTVIANAPNPAGQSLLKRYFENGISPARLLGAATVPTAIMVLCFIAFND